jgi:hypothetical protein
MSGAEEATMAQFLLLARDRGSEVFAGMSPEEIQRIIQKYIDWGAKLEAQGRMRAHHKLADGEGRVLRAGDSGVRITDGPFSETKEVIGGFWVFEAADYDEALALVRDHPHHARGTLELRRIEVL